MALELLGILEANSDGEGLDPFDLIGGSCCSCSCSCSCLFSFPCPRPVRLCVPSGVSRDVVEGGSVTAPFRSGLLKLGMVVDPSTVFDLVSMLTAEAPGLLLGVFGAPSVGSDTVRFCWLVLVSDSRLLRCRILFPKSTC